jgi:Tol biopolymer transport system component
MFEASVALVALMWCAFNGRAADQLPGIVFVSDDILGPHHLVDGRPGTAHWREGYIYHRATSSHPLERTTTPTRPGRNLYTLIPARPDGTLRRITHLTEGEVFDPEPSYDGRRILFSMRRDGEDWFHLYEIGADGLNLVQLTDGPFNDVSGVYLPDGRIVFVSDRAGYLE